MTEPVSTPSSRAATGWLPWAAAGCGALVLLAAYLIIRPGDNYIFPYFSDLARSFWHGRLDIVPSVNDQFDLSLYKGRLYPYWPPLPAILMMPVVPFTGTTPFPIHLFALFFGMVNAGLFAWVVRQADRRFDLDLGAARQAWLVAGAAIGSSNLIFAIYASHYFTAQLVTSTMALAAMGFALDATGSRRAAWASAAFFGAAIGGRAHLILSLPFWIGFAVDSPGASQPGNVGGWREWWPALRPMIAAAVVAGLFAIYNTLRFGSPFDMGLRYHMAGEVFSADFKNFGVFNPAYIIRNVYVTVFRLPFFGRWDGYDPGMGFSLFLQTPLFLLILAPVRKDLRDARALLAVGAALTTIPIFLCMGTGYYQYGARYLYDVAPFLLVWVTMAAARRPTWLIALLSVASVGANLYGLHWLFTPQ